MKLAILKRRVNQFRYCFLMLVVVFHVLMLRNTSFTIRYPVRDANGLVSVQTVYNITPHVYDSLLKQLPLISNDRSLVASSRSIHYFKVLPRRTMNLIYSLYVYYMVVAVIRTIIYVRRLTKPTSGEVGN